MRIYISGPITGVPMETCYGNFNSAAFDIKKRGHDPVNPLEVPVLICLDPEQCETTGNNGHTWNCWMRADIAWMMRCDAAYALDGWQESKGARVEIGLAESLGMPVYYESLKHDLPIPPK